MSEQTTMKLARSLADLYDPERGGTAVAVDGFVLPEMLDHWLQFGALGQTSNQTLFLKKVDAGLLDDDIRALHREGRSPMEIYNELYNREALASARQIERWVDPTRRLNFSRETDATRAADGDAIAAEAVDLQQLSPLIMVKLANVGASPEAIRAMLRQAVAQGLAAGRLVNPNITLVFGASHYVNTVAGYIEGLEAVSAQGADLSRLLSVNSLFVSRTDTAVDGLIKKRMEAVDTDEEKELLSLLLGKTALAHAKKVYQMFRAIFLGEEFVDPYGLYTPELRGPLADLRDAYARIRAAHPELRPQRVLMASSGNKQTGVYSELLYVLPLFGEQVGNTLPPATLEALEARLTSTGLPCRDTILDPLPWMPQTGETIAAWEEAVMWGGAPETKTPDEILHLVHTHVLEPAGTDLETVCNGLRDKGAQSFAEDQMKAYEVFGAKVKELAEG
jgi:transaldolase